MLRVVVAKCSFSMNIIFYITKLIQRLFHFSQQNPKQEEWLHLAIIIDAPRCLSYNYIFYSQGMEGNQILLKLISVGDTKVGKSCIIKRYCEGRFVQKYITTIGVDYGVKKVTVSSRKIAVNFFDLSGSTDYEEIRNPFYADAQVIMLIFDLQNRESFNNLGKWEAVMKNYGVTSKQSVIMLVGNKCDGRTKQVDSSEAIAYAKKKGYEYFQVSASTGENINEVFEKAFTKAVSGMEDKKKALTL